MRGWTLPKRRALVIVPDDVLWYLPFEALVPDAGEAGDGAGRSRADPLRTDGGAGDQQSAAAAPHAADRHRRQRAKRAMTTRRHSEEMLQELEKVVSGPLRLPSPLPEPPRLVAPLLDALIGFDDIEANRRGALRLVAAA